MIDDRVAAIAARHGVPADRVRAVPSGVANRVYLLGDDLVLRVARSAEHDLAKEAAVIPVARAAGVRTPAVVSFDGDAMVLARVPGTDLADRARPPAVLHELGRELAVLHQVTAPESARAGALGRAELPEMTDGDDPRILVASLRRAGMVDAESAAWLDRCFDRLARRRPADPAAVLVHGDVAPQNLLADAGRLTGVVDWGDAAWADPAVDFAKMPLIDVPVILVGYRGDDSLPARILWYHLTWALGRLAAPTPRPGVRHWSAPPAGRLLSLLRFVASGPPEPWAELTR